MFCNVCGCHVLEATEYRTGKVGGYRAPAGRCTSCGAITLREDFASTPRGGAPLHPDRHCVAASRLRRPTARRALASGLVSESLARLT